LPSPTLSFAVLTATLIGALMHLIIGGDLRRLLLLLVSSWLGFGIGHFLGAALQIESLNVGTLYLLPAVSGALTACSAALVLTSPKRRKRLTR
jgi:hypothetical protein